MSAIWGVVDLSRKEIDKALSSRMSKCLENYRIDKVMELSEDNAYMGCGLQYITKQDRAEKLPISENSDFFTADCYLDNREELISEIGKELPDERLSEDTPDGRLLYLAFKIWGEKFGDHVLGAFSFANYNKDTNEFYLFTDHISSRSVHYYVQGDRLFFGTLTSCITDVCPEIDVCDKWMSACMAMDFPVLTVFEGLSPFENVFMLPYGCGVKAVLSKGKAKATRIRYYDPISEIHEDKSITDARAKELFIETFKKAVKGTLRADGEVGVLLSSGLDSTTVASMAATILKDRGDSLLHSYTSIPLKVFDKNYDNPRNYWTDDESGLVKILCKRYDNIKPTFMDCEGKSVLSNIKKYVDYMEFPGKALINHVWMYEAYEKARADGCKILLCGNHGNYTISHGSIFNSAYRALREGRIVTAFNQVCYDAKCKKISRKGHLKRFFQAVQDDRRMITIDEIVTDQSYRKELLDKYGVRKAWEDLMKREGDGISTRKQFENSVVSTFVLQLMGLYETKDSLDTGVLVRDPTRDKRILELCLKLPYERFAWDGQDRRLVREYMKDYIPDEIRLVSRHRGRQSGDALLRYKSFGLPGGEKEDNLIDKDIARYFDIDKARAIMQEETTEDNIRRKVKILACSIFMKNVRKKRESLV